MNDLVLLKIFGYLEPLDLLRCVDVSESFAEIVYDKSLWPGTGDIESRQRKSVSLIPYTNRNEFYLTHDLGYYCELRLYIYPSIISLLAPGSGMYRYST